jgi:hypothetical protein
MRAYARWIGNSEETADEHYEDVTAADWTSSGVSAPLNAPPAEDPAEARR